MDFTAPQSPHWNDSFCFLIRCFDGNRPTLFSALTAFHFSAKGIRVLKTYISKCLILWRFITDNEILVKWSNLFSQIQTFRAFFICYPLVGDGKLWFDAQT